VDDDEFMTIGRFARLTGLSIGTLRHYDEVGLLSPASVDPSSGYRRYRRQQAERARQIRMLRWDDLPVEEIRQIINDETGAVTADILARHRRRLERQRDLLTARIRDTGRFLEEGITMPAVQTGCRPAQIKIAVDDMDGAVAFYAKAFGFRYDVVRRTEETDYSAFVFGTYGKDDFFLFHLVTGQDRMDLPGQSTFGLLTDDLDACHARAVDAGATEVVAPHDAEGMPRCSAIRDPRATGPDGDESGFCVVRCAAAPHSSRHGRWAGPGRTGQCSLMGTRLDLTPSVTPTMAGQDPSRITRRGGRWRRSGRWRVRSRRRWCPAARRCLARRLAAQPGRR
jgi:DNA-binding transcriptional MerR regulator